MFFCGSFVSFMSCVCHAFTSVHCFLVVTCSGRADLLALVCDALLCFMLLFPCTILGQVWYLIVSISDFFPPFSLIDIIKFERHFLNSTTYTQS